MIGIKLYFDPNFELLSFPSLLFLVLRAMKEDSEKVPSLLTDYILKGELHNGLCTVVGKLQLVNASSC